MTNPIINVLNLSQAVDAVLETWDGAMPADLDRNYEYLRGEVELLVELYGRGFIHDDLGILADTDDRREALEECVRKTMLHERETCFGAVAFRKGWNADFAVTVLTDFIEQMKPVFPALEPALVTYAQDIAERS